NAFQAGLVTVPYVIMAVVMIRLGEKLSLRFGGKPLLLVGPLFPAIGIMFISLMLLATQWYVGFVVFGFVICAIGNGLCATPCNTVAIVPISDEQVRLASGIHKTCPTLGGALGIALNTTVFSALKVKHSPRVAETASSSAGLSIKIIGVLLTQIII